MRSSLFACLALCLVGCSSDEDSSGSLASGGNSGADSGTGGATGGSGSTGGSAGSGSGGTPTDAGTDAPYVRQNLLFESTFDESAPLDQWNNGQHCCDYSVQISTDFAKAGDHSIRFELHKDDPVVSSGKRSEVNLDGDAPEAERWVGVSFYLPATWGVDNTPESVIQWHHPSGSGSPPLSLWIEDGVYTLVHSTDSAGNDFQYEDVGNADTEAWTDFVFHIKWSKSSSGHLELFKNGTSVFTYDGVTTYDLPEGNYLKLGIYKWPWLDSNTSSVVDQRVLYADELRVGSELATYLDVAP